MRAGRGSGTVSRTTDVRGTAARLQVVGGNAVTPLGLSVGVSSPPAGGNVPDAAHATIPQLEPEWTAALSQAWGLARGSVCRL